MRLRKIVNGQVFCPVRSDWIDVFECGVGHDRKCPYYRGIEWIDGERYVKCDAE